MWHVSGRSQKIVLFFPWLCYHESIIDLGQYRMTDRKATYVGPIIRKCKWIRRYETFKRHAFNKSLLVRWMNYANHFVDLICMAYARPATVLKLRNMASITANQVKSTVMVFLIVYREAQVLLGGQNWYRLICQ